VPPWPEEQAEASTDDLITQRRTASQVEGHYTNTDQPALR
jgi:hypothetical protein